MTSGRQVQVAVNLHLGTLTSLLRSLSTLDGRVLKEVWLLLQNVDAMDQLLAASFLHRMLALAQCSAMFQSLGKMSCCTWLSVLWRHHYTLFGGCGYCSCETTGTNNGADWHGDVVL